MNGVCVGISKTPALAGVGTGTIGAMPSKAAPPSWHQDVLPSLGKQTDADIARKHGLTARQVGYLRKSLNIDPVCKSRWLGEVSKQIGVVPDAVLAEKIGVSESAVQQKRKSRELKHERWGMPPEARALLGKITDAEMAARFGRHTDTVRLWRTKAGIPALRERRPWSGKELVMLGKMPDNIVARLTKRRLYTVKKKRESLKIAAYCAT